MDIDPTHTQEPALRFVLSPSPTPASSTYTPAVLSEEEGAWLEVCPQGLVLAQEIAERVVTVGGAALIADYGSGGETGGKRNTLRVRLVVCLSCAVHEGGNRQRDNIDSKLIIASPSGIQQTQAPRRVETTRPGRPHS